MILDAEPGHGEGRLASACKVAGCASGDLVTMRYDGEGRRVELVTRPNGGAATTTTFRDQGSAIAQELTGTGTLTLVRTYLTDEAGTIVKVCDPDCTGTNPSYLVTYNGHGDALALWRIEANGSLTLANSYTYSTWGAPTTATHNAYPDLGYRYLYVGAQGVAWDNALGLGLLHMGARHYSPTLGRFLQPDPSALETNLYGYGANSPVMKADPSGEDSGNIGPNSLAGEMFELRYLRYLKRFGWTVHPRSGVNTPLGYRSVDIVATKNGRVVRIELKWGSSRHEGTPQFLKDLHIATRPGGQATRIVRSTRGMIRSYTIRAGGTIGTFGGGGKRKR